MTWMRLTEAGRRAASRCPGSTRYAVEPSCVDDDLVKLRADEVEGGAVVRRVSGRESVRDELAVHGPAPILAVVVRARASRQEAEPVPHPFELRPERVGDARLEPADHPRAPAAEQRPVLPRLAEHRVEPVHPPDRESVRRVPARDVDRVLREHVLAQVRAWPGVEQDVTRLSASGERLVERDRDLLGVRARRRDEADARPGELEHEIVEAASERESAYRKDPAGHADECRFPPQRRL